MTPDTTREAMQAIDALVHAAIGFAQDRSEHTERRMNDARRKVEAAFATPDVQPVAIPNCTVADVGFRWDGERQHHVPQLVIEFGPVARHSLPKRERRAGGVDAYRVGSPCEPALRSATEGAQPT